MPLLQSFCIFFAILVVFVIIKETTKGAMHNLNEAEVKRELEESKEFYKLIKRELWLRRVASKEARRLGQFKESASWYEAPLCSGLY